MTDWIHRIEENIRTHRLLPSGSAVLVAVSGGLDSMVLLRALHDLAPAHGWRLAVAHFNHRLRGKASDGDEAFVRQQAGRLGIGIEAGSADVASFAQSAGISIEMAARTLRHRFLAETARKLGIMTVAMAHHADDQIELFLLRLLRGTGGEGLSGMKWGNPSPADAAVRLARPLLDQPRTALETFAKARRIRFREDASNARLDIQRNRIRHELIPLLLKNYQPALRKTLPRVMEIAGEESEFAGRAAEEWLERKRPAFADVHPAVQRRVIQLQLARLGLRPDFELIEELRRRAGKVVAAGPALKVWRDNDGMLRTETVEGVAGLTHRGGGIGIALSAARGEALFDGVRFSWRVVRRRKAAPAAREGFERFDAEAVGSSIVLRHWRPGDRFRPIGCGSARKLQDLFVNAKIDRKRRRQLVVAQTAEGEIFWVEGLRIGERFKLGAATVSEVEWRWERPELSESV